MTLDAEHVILVLDRMKISDNSTPEDVASAVEGFNSLAKSAGAAGGLIFAQSVDLPNGELDSEGLTIHADELAALRRMLDVVNGVAGAGWRPDDRAVIELLIQRAEQ
jgi:hypothetical protein